jgi:outer membrane protein, multidrug efflux system
VTRSQTLVDQLKSNIPTIDVRRQNALFQLAVLTGKPPGAFDAGLTKCVAAPPILDPIPIGDGAALLKRRPDIRAAERELAASTAEIGVAMADLYPRIALKASIGSTGLVGDFLQHTTDEWALGPVVSWQLNQSAARARIAAATAAQKAQLAIFDGIVLGALRDVETALNGYSHDLAREATLKAARDEAGKAVADAHLLEAGGRSGALSTLDAERTLASTEAALASIAAQVSQDQVALFLALGGGWETAALEVDNKP